MTTTKLRQLVTSRAFIASATGVVLAALAQAGVHVSPAVRTDAVNVLSIAAPIALPAYAWLRAHLAKKSAPPVEDGTPGSSGVAE